MDVMKTMQFKLNIPSATREKIKAVAVDNHRSMSAEIIHRLEKSFKANESPHFPDRINADAV